MRKIINRFKYLKKFIIKSEGNSMWPVLHSRDVLYYTKTKINKIQIDDIVLVEKENKLLTHRVIYKTYKFLITKGDGNLSSDGKIFSNQLIGKVYKVKRNGEIFIK